MVEIVLLFKVSFYNLKIIFTIRVRYFNILRRRVINRFTFSFFILDKRLPPGFPNITNPPSSKAVEVGHNAVLHCTVTGDPTPKVWWIRELLPLDIANNDRYSILESGSPGMSNVHIFRIIITDIRKREI